MKHNFFSWQVNTLALGCLLLGMPLWGQGITDGTNTMEIIVPVGTVAEQNDVIVSSYSGIIVSPQSVRIVSRVYGELLELGFKDGDHVKKGQLLYRLDDTKYKAAVKKIKAQLDQSKAKVNYAQKSFDRTDMLYSKNAASLDSKENLQSVLDALQASEQESEAELISAEEDLRNCIIRAPIDGMVTTTNYTPGNYLTPSSGTLVTLFQIDPVRVRFFISNRDFLEHFSSQETLKKDCRVTLSMANGEAYPEEGRFELMNMEANKNTDTVQIYALFANGKHTLLPNSTVTVTLTKKTAKRLPAIPSTAVMHDSHGAYVWLLGKGNIVKKQHVILGNTDGTTQLILSGIKAGEEIVTDGTHKVMDGVKIVPDRKGR